eukprot:jgi/Mesvir1/6130/Mv00834-RA.1
MPSARPPPRARRGDAVSRSHETHTPLLPLEPNVGLMALSRSTEEKRYFTPPTQDHAIASKQAPSDAPQGSPAPHRLSRACTDSTPTPTSAEAPEDSPNSDGDTATNAVTAAGKESSACAPSGDGLWLQDADIPQLGIEAASTPSLLQASGDCTTLRPLPAPSGDPPSLMDVALPSATGGMREMAAELDADADICMMSEDPDNVSVLAVAPSAAPVVGMLGEDVASPAVAVAEDGLIEGGVGARAGDDAVQDAGAPWEGGGGADLVRTGMGPRAWEAGAPGEKLASATHGSLPVSLPAGEEGTLGERPLRMPTPEAALNGLRAGRCDMVMDDGDDVIIDRDEVSGCAEGGDWMCGGGGGVCGAAQPLPLDDEEGGPNGGQADGGDDIMPVACVSDQVPLGGVVGREGFRNSGDVFDGDDEDMVQLGDEDESAAPPMTLVMGPASPMSFESRCVAQPGELSDACAHSVMLAPARVPVDAPASATSCLTTAALRVPAQEADDGMEVEGRGHEGAGPQGGERGPDGREAGGATSGPSGGSGEGGQPKARPLSYMERKIQQQLESREDFQAPLGTVLGSGTLRESNLEREKRLARESANQGNAHPDSHGAVVLGGAGEPPCPGGGLGDILVKKSKLELVEAAVTAAGTSCGGGSSGGEEPQGRDHPQAHRSNTGLENMVLRKSRLELEKEAFKASGASDVRTSTEARPNPASATPAQWADGGLGSMVLRKSKLELEKEAFKAAEESGQMRSSLPRPQAASSEMAGAGLGGVVIKKSKLELEKEALRAAEASGQTTRGPALPRSASSTPAAEVADGGLGSMVVKKSKLELEKEAAKATEAGGERALPGARPKSAVSSVLVATGGGLGDMVVKKSKLQLEQEALKAAEAGSERASPGPQPKSATPSAAAATGGGLGDMVVKKSKLQLEQEAARAATAETGGLGDNATGVASRGRPPTPGKYAPAPASEAGGLGDLVVKKSRLELEKEALRAAEAAGEAVIRRGRATARPQSAPAVGASEGGLESMVVRKSRLELEKEAARAAGESCQVRSLLPRPKTALVEVADGGLGSMVIKKSRLEMEKEAARAAAEAERNAGNNNNKSNNNGGAAEKRPHAATCPGRQDDSGGGLGDMVVKKSRLELEKEASKAVAAGADATGGIAGKGRRASGSSAGTWGGLGDVVIKKSKLEMEKEALRAAEAAAGGATNPERGGGASRKQSSSGSQHTVVAEVGLDALLVRHKSKLEMEKEALRAAEGQAGDGGVAGPALSVAVRKPRVAEVISSVWGGDGLEAVMPVRVPTRGSEQPGVK